MQRAGRRSEIGAQPGQGRGIRAFGLGLFEFTDLQRTLQRARAGADAAAFTRHIGRQ